MHQDPYLLHCCSCWWYRVFLFRYCITNIGSLYSPRSRSIAYSKHPCQTEQWNGGLWRRVSHGTQCLDTHTLEHCRRHLAGQGLSLPRFPGTIYQTHTVSHPDFGCCITVSDLPVPVSRNHPRKKQATTSNLMQSSISILSFPNVTIYLVDLDSYHMYY